MLGKLKIILKPVMSENNRVTLKRAIVLQNPDSAKNKINQFEQVSSVAPNTTQPPVKFANIQNELNLLEHFEQFESQQMKTPSDKNDKRTYKETFSHKRTLLELDVNTEMTQDD